MTCRVGTSGYFYRSWRGRFYPSELPPSQFFAYYQEHFDTVELNSTFYRFPTPAKARRWAKEAKDGFLYAVKAHREITHLKKFRDPERLAAFYRAIEPLGEKLGPVLFQLPPRFSYDEERLARVLGALDLGFQNAIEFRHPSWWRPEVYEALRARGVAFVSVSAPGLPEEVVNTAFYYLRFHGKTAWYKYDYSDAELAAWAERLQPGVPRFAYFNNTDQGHAPLNALRFKEMVCR